MKPINLTKFKLRQPWPLPKQLEFMPLHRLAGKGWLPPWRVRHYIQAEARRIAGDHHDDPSA